MNRYQYRFSSKCRYTDTDTDTDYTDHWFIPSRGVLHFFFVNAFLTEKFVKPNIAPILLNNDITRSES